MEYKWLKLGEFHFMTGYDFFFFAKNIKSLSFIKINISPVFPLHVSYADERFSCSDTGTIFANHCKVKIIWNYYSGCSEDKQVDKCSNIP
jgi:hypothetical protein